MTDFFSAQVFSDDIKRGPYLQLYEDSVGVSITMLPSSDYTNSCNLDEYEEIDE